MNMAHSPLAGKETKKGMGMGMGMGMGGGGREFDLWIFKRGRELKSVATLLSAMKFVAFEVLEELGFGT
jgi:hypothetical protein